MTPEDAYDHIRAMKELIRSPPPDDGQHRCSEPTWVTSGGLIANDDGPLMEMRSGWQVYCFTCKRDILIEHAADLGPDAAVELHRVEFASTT